MRWNGKRRLACDPRTILDARIWVLVNVERWHRLPQDFGPSQTAYEVVAMDPSLSEARLERGKRAVSEFIDYSRSGGAALARARRIVHQRRIFCRQHARLTAAARASRCCAAGDRARNLDSQRGAAPVTA